MMDMIKNKGGMTAIKRKATINKVNTWMDDYTYLWQEMDLSRFNTPTDRKLININRYPLLMEEGSVNQILNGIIDDLKITVSSQKLKARGIVADRAWNIFIESLQHNDDLVDVIDCNISEFYYEFKRK